MDNKTKFKWVIPNYQENLHKNKSYDSQSFIMVNYPYKRWYLSIEKIYAWGNVVQFTSRCDESCDNCLVDITMSISIMDSSNEELVTVEKKYSGKFEEKWHKLGLMEHSYLLDNLVGDDLIINYEMEVDLKVPDIKDESMSDEEEDPDFVNNKIFSDISLHFGRRKIFGHRIILAMNSPVFEEMLTEKMELRKIKITDVSYEIFTKVLQYMYTGEVEKLDEFALDILKAARLYEMKDLITTCEDALVVNINLDNVLETLIVADECESQRMKNTCLMFIQCHFEHIQNSSQLEELSKSHSHLLLEIVNVLPLQKQFSFQRRNFNSTSSKAVKFSPFLN